MKHFPHEMQREKSISATPDAFFLIAPTGQASSHGTVVFTIAWYGHALMHLPHLMHFVWSITDLPPTISIAPFGHAVVHGRAKHPRQLAVDTTADAGQPLHAGPQTVSGWS